MCGSQQLQHEPFFCLMLSYYSDCRCQVICKIECDLIPNFKNHVPRLLTWNSCVTGAYCGILLTLYRWRYIEVEFSTVIPVIVLIQLPSSNVYFSFVGAIISDLTKQLQTNIKRHHLIMPVCLPYSLFMYQTTYDVCLKLSHIYHHKYIYFFASDFLTLYVSRSINAALFPSTCLSCWPHSALLSNSNFTAFLTVSWTFCNRCYCSSNVNLFFEGYSALLAFIVLPLFFDLPALPH